MTDPSSPTFTPDEGGLAIHYYAGRWFVGWRDLDAAADLAEAAKHELMRIAPASAPTGGPGGCGFEFSEV